MPVPRDLDQLLALLPDLEAVGAVDARVLLALLDPDHGSRAHGAIGA